MTNNRPHIPDPEERERVEEAAAEAKADNPDPETRRETFELDLMAEGLSEDGELVELDDEADNDR
jgi:hypothetical protein